MAQPRVLPSPVPPVDQLRVPGTPERIETTLADGTRIGGWLITPRGASADQPAPAVLWIHGGPLSSWNAWHWRWNPHLLVDRGYAVVLPDPGLSTGYGVDFVRRGWGRWGEEPYTDLMAVMDDVVARPDIDATRTAAMGGSFGGYMANWIAGPHRPVPDHRHPCLAVGHARLPRHDRLGHHHGVRVRRPVP